MIHRIAAVALAAFLALPAMAGGQAWSVDNWTVTGGGEVLTDGGPWQLSGTLGQTGSRPASGGPWEATGGFWTVTVTETEVLFRDEFDG